MPTLALLGKYVHHFTAQTTIAIPGPTHGLATDDLLVQVYDSTGTSVGGMPHSINPTTFDVVITGLHSMSGRVVLIG